jgi:DNA adenine methylase
VVGGKLLISKSPATNAQGAPNNELTSANTQTTKELADSTDNQTVSEVRPLLKWAGGKRQLLPVLRRFYPPQFNRYIEPFFGSGAVFFDLQATGHLAGRKASLIDDNADLVGCYRMVRDRSDEVLAALAQLAADHARGGVRCFYHVRDECFNPRRAELARNGRPEHYTPALAAMLIYLNRTGFNGLFRLNARGEFNVPAGRYEAPRIYDADHVRAVARALQSPGVNIEWASFEGGLESASEGDFLYCDPPYAPLTSTARFTSYTAKGFTSADHGRLQAHVIAAAHRGATVLVSNSSAPEILRLYGSQAAHAAGLRLVRVPARRAISSKHSTRGPIDELVIANTAHRRLPTRARMARASLRPLERRRA